MLKLTLVLTLVLIALPLILCLNLDQEVNILDIESIDNNLNIAYLFEDSYNLTKLAEIADKSISLRRLICWNWKFLYKIDEFEPYAELRITYPVIQKISNLISNVSINMMEELHTMISGYQPATHGLEDMSLQQLFMELQISPFKLYPERRGGMELDRRTKIEIKIILNGKSMFPIYKQILNDNGSSYEKGVVASILTNTPYLAFDLYHDLFIAMTKLDKMSSLSKLDMNDKYWSLGKINELIVKIDTIYGEKVNKEYHEYTIQMETILLLNMYNKYS